MQFVFAYRGSGELETLAGVNHVLSGPIAAHDSCRQATHLPILLTPGIRGKLFYSSLCSMFFQSSSRHWHWQFSWTWNHMSLVPWCADCWCADHLWLSPHWAMMGVLSELMLVFQNTMNHLSLIAVMVIWAVHVPAGGPAIMGHCAAGDSGESSILHAVILPIASHSTFYQPSTHLTVKPLGEKVG